MDKVTRVHEDIMIEGWNDLVNAFLRYSFTDPDHLSEFLDRNCKDQLRNLENLYVRYGVMMMMVVDVQKRFMVSDVPTVADAIAYGIVEQLRVKREGIVDDFASLKKWKNDFESLEEVKAYNAL